MKSLVALLITASLVAGLPYEPPVQDAYAQQQGNHPPTQHSSPCSHTEDCVFWQQCKNGVIDVTGAGQLDLRVGGNKAPESYGYIDCGPVGNVCCGIPVDAYGGGGIVPVVDSGVSVTGTGSGYDGSAHVHDAGGDNYQTGPVGVVGGDGGYNDASSIGSVGSGHQHPASPVSGPPYPSCSAGLLCIEEEKCNLYTGFIGTRIPLYEGQPFVEYKHCTTEYLNVGICCQEQPAKVVDQGYVDPSVGETHGNVHVGGDGYVDPVQTHGGVQVGGDGYVDPVQTHGGVQVGGDGYVDPVQTHGGVQVGGDGYVDPGQTHGGVQVGGDGYVDPVQTHGGVQVGGDGYVEPAIGIPHSAGSLGDYDDNANIFGDYTGCSPNEECVQSLHCRKGEIITDGSGLIDLRIKTDYKKCIDPAYNEEGVCCRKPGSAPVVKVCPDYSICTPLGYCDTNGIIIPNSVSNYGYATGIDCFTNPDVTYNVGVCCSPPTPVPPPIVVLETCPIDSVCIPSDFCFGDVYDNNAAWVPYLPGGTWSQCTLPNLVDRGVCCKNPKPVTPQITQQCGVSHYGLQDDNLKTRIHVPQLDKLEADFGELPWQAIVFFSNYTFKCGASLISDQHLLTVGHCVNGLYPEDIKIRLGEWQVNTFAEPLPYQDIDVSSIIIHPQFVVGSYYNNIAILKLKTPIQREYNINSVCLPWGPTNFAPGTRCLVSGWGKDSFEGTYQHILKKIDVPLVDHHYCEELLRKTRLGRWFKLHDSYMCAGGELGKDACVGDGGGPLICEDSVTKSYVQVGITAWGIGCGEENVPGAYTDISKFTPWIASNTGLTDPAKTATPY